MLKFHPPVALCAKREEATSGKTNRYQLLMVFHHITPYDRDCEKLVFDSKLMWQIQDFSAFICHESFNSDSRKVFPYIKSTTRV
jgi:hypothetical protein